MTGVSYPMNYSQLQHNQKHHAHSLFIHSSVHTEATFQVMVVCEMVINGVHFKGMNRDECVAPIPGRPCFTGL